MKEISSVQNPLVKRIVSLQEKSKNRKTEGVFIIEGKRELSIAIRCGYQIQTIFFQPKIITQSAVNQLVSLVSETPEYIKISSEVFQKLAYRSSTEGIIAVAKAKSHQLSDLHFQAENPLILVAEAPEKPGNIGALLRTANAADVDAVLIANPKTDLYNPNIIRSSVGGVFATQIALGSTSEIISFLQKQKINIFCAALSASKPYTEVDFSEASAIVVGTEDEGLTPEWLSNSTQNIIIPMAGIIDSMNVSVAASVLVFEAKRQRS